MARYSGTSFVIKISLGTDPIFGRAYPSCQLRLTLLAKWISLANFVMRNTGLRKRYLDPLPVTPSLGLAVCKAKWLSTTLNSFHVVCNICFLIVAKWLEISA